MKTKANNVTDQLHLQKPENALNFSQPENTVQFINFQPILINAGEKVTEFRIQQQQSFISLGEVGYMENSEYYHFFLKKINTVTICRYWR